jgi:hypothetical protein
MVNQWEDLFREIIDETAGLIRNEIKDMLDSAKNDSEKFLNRQAKKVEKYLNQFARGEINKTQLKGYLRDIAALSEMHGLQLSLQARVRLQRLTKGIIDLIIDKMLAFF